MLRTIFEGRFRTYRCGSLNLEVVDEVIDEGRRSVSSLIPKVVVTNKCPKNLELSLLMEKRLSFVEGSNLSKLKMKLSMMIKL